MKKLLKKSILTFAALLAVSSAMAISAFADVTADSIKTDVVKDDAGKATSVKVTVTGAEAGDQMTVLLLAPGEDGKFNDTNVQEGDIKYINQDAAATLTGTDVGVTYTIALPEKPADKYLLKVGGEKVAAGIPKEIVLNGNIDDGDWVLGDVTGDKKVNGEDSTHILQYAVKLRKTFDNEKDNDTTKIGDVTGDGKINGEDSTHILQYAVKLRKTFDRQK